MKLFHSPTSPYVRKVMACALARGVEGRITLVRANPHVSPPELLAANPLSKVPCLVTDDGLALFDSPVICEFLDSVGDVNPLIPTHGAARWRVLKLQAMADGILDAAITRRAEQGRPAEEVRHSVIARQKAAVERTLAVLEAEPPARHVDLGSISVACALGYLDFRFANEPWRKDHPKLAAWCEDYAKHPPIAATQPKDPA